MTSTETHTEEIKVAPNDEQCMLILSCSLLFCFKYFLKYWLATHKLISLSIIDQHMCLKNTNISHIHRCVVLSHSHPLRMRLLGNIHTILLYACFA